MATMHISFVSFNFVYLLRFKPSRYNEESKSEHCSKVEHELNSFAVMPQKSHDHYTHIT